MNKFETNFNGGFPLALDDFRFIDDSVRLAISDICRSLGVSDSVILYGCQLQLQGNYTSVSEGAIYHNGEIWHVFPHNFSTPAGVTTTYWNFMEQNDAAGSKTFFDGLERQVYKIRKAICSVQADPESITSLQGDSVIRLSDLSESIADLTLGANIIPANNAYRQIVLKRGRTARLELSVKANISENTVLATIPVGYRPTAYLSGLCFDSSSDFLFRYSIDKDSGQVKVYQMTGGILATAYITIQIGYII
jgi:hypothetical protein